MNPNQIIAALLDVASAAFAVNHDATKRMIGDGSGMKEGVIDAHDLDKLAECLLKLEEIPMAEHESYTGPARARIALSSFIGGEQQEPATLDASCWICADTGMAFGKVCEHPKLERRVRPRFIKPAPAPRDPIASTISRLIETPLYDPAVPLRVTEEGKRAEAAIMRDMQAHGDAELLGKLRDLCGSTQDGSNEPVMIYEDDATNDWVVSVGHSANLGSMCRRYTAKSFHQAIRTAADAESPDEPEVCAFCGATVVNPCDEPPVDTCEKALNATYGDPLTPKNPVEQKAVPLGSFESFWKEVHPPYQVREIGEEDWRDASPEVFYAAKRAPEMDARYNPKALQDWMRVLVFADMKERLALPDGDEAAIGPLEVLYDLNRIASGGEKPLIYPSEFNDHLKQILGTMCFHVINYMSIYRKSGFNIPTGAEHEQAFMIDRLLRAYLAHGDKWAEVVNTEMRELHAKLQEKGEGK